MGVKQTVYIEDIRNYVGQEVVLKGWLYNKRSSGKIAFLQLRDGTGIIQCVVVYAEVPAEIFEKVNTLVQESSFEVRGVVREDPRSPIGYEMAVRDLNVIHIGDEYPITKKEHGTAYLMEHRHLWLRSRRQHAVLRIRSELVEAIRDYFYRNKFTLIDSPIFTPSACEGTTTLFEVNYFDDKAYLTQSGQLYVEAGAMAFGKVYCFGPTFRAEKSKTRRHLTEFWMVEPEVAFMDIEGDMELAEDFVVDIVQRVVANRKEEFKVLERDISKLERIQKPFPRISYTEAIDMLKSKGRPIEWGGDFGAEDETALSEAFDRPVIVHRYPSEIKAFYMKHDPSDPKVALCMDMIAPEGYGEIIGGGQREDDHQTLLGRIEHHKLPVDAFRWYLDLRKYGSVPHAGFGLGIERTLSWICGIHHVRETIPFPRMLEKMVF